MRDLIYFLASVIGISSFFFTDILLLRGFYLCSSLLFIVSGFIFQIYIMVAMNILYTVVNVVQIIRLLMERSMITLPHDLKLLYRHLFFNMEPREFLYLMKLSEKRQIPAHNFMCHQGDENTRLMLILSGITSIIISEKTVSKMGNQFYFIGEMSFVTQKPMVASVRTETDVSYVEWPYECLIQLKSQRPHLYTKLLEVIGRDLIRKIQNQTEQC